MRFCHRAVVVAITALVALGCSSTQPPSNASQSGLFTLDELLGRMPARDSLEARWLSASLVERGEAGIVEICKRLGPMGTEGNADAEDALQLLATHVTRPGGEADRRMFVSAIGKSLEQPRGKREAAFLLARLQVAGRGESVPAISRFLKDESLCEPAAQALVAVREGADAPLISALTGASRDNRITILRALGALGSKASVEEVTKEAASADPAIRREALAALAEVGDPASEKLLISAVQSTPEGERDIASWNLLRYAERRAEAGDAASAARIARALGGAPGQPGHIRAAALDVLAGVEADAALPDLLKALDDPERSVRVAALRTSGKLKGTAITNALAGRLKTASPDLKADLLVALGRRGDRSAGGAILESLSDTSLSVRQGAIEGAGGLLGVEAVPAFLKHLENSSDPGDIDAVRSALRQMPAKETIPIVAPALPRLTPRACAGLIEYLAAYGALVPPEPIVALATHDDPQVQTAATKALGSVARAEDQKKLIDILVTRKSEGEQSVALTSLVSASGRIQDADQRTSQIVTAYGSAQPADRPVLLRALGRLGGANALDLVVRETKSKDAATKDAAVRALADWPTMEGFDSLLAFSRSTDRLQLHVVALRGCVRMAEGAVLDPATSTLYLKRALGAARRVEEKRLVIGALANHRTPEALRTVVPYLGDPALGLDAAMAAESIANSSGRRSQGEREMSRVLIEHSVSSKVKPDVSRSFDARSTVNDPPEDFTALFNGRDLTGWKGLFGNPLTRAGMEEAQLNREQQRADSIMRAHWSVASGVLVFDGKGESICTVRDFANFEMLVDWMIQKEGDSGVYLRGSPQVQIWDPAQWPEGSGGLYNNEKHPARPSIGADRPVGEWNTFRIRMIGESVWVWLNSVLVVDSVVLENYWDRAQPIFPAGQIELQAHNTPLAFRNIYIRELPAVDAPFTGELFNGKDLTGWRVIDGSPDNWTVENEILRTDGIGEGWLSTEREFGDFELDLDFRISASGNSGVFIRTPREGDPAYTGMEIQVLDDYSPEHASLKPWQYTGSIYGLQAPAERATKKADEWQHLRILADGPKVSVTLNGRQVVDADLVKHLDRESVHPGLKRRHGFIGLQSHGSRVEYRNIAIRTLR